MRPKRIAFYGNFGDGNLGNEVTLQTIIEHTRRRWPDVELECICTGPEDVRARHGIAAFCSQPRGLGTLWRRWKAQRAERAGAVASGAGAGGVEAPVTPGSQQRQADHGARRVVLRAARPILRAIKGLLYKLPLEIIHWARSLRVIARCDVLLVPGTGILTDHRCGPWVWPYELFKCCALAGLCRVEVVFLSVGAGPIHTRLGRWMITRSLKLARYRSFRDEDSRRCLNGLGFNVSRDAVYPDLVFGLDTRTLLQSGGGAGDARERVVGLGLKDYSGPAEGSDASGYRGYLEAMATFVSWLGGRGYTVRLLIGDFQYDDRVRQDLLQLLASRNPGADRTRVLLEPVPTVGELLRQLAATDIVISSRLHNLILALMLGKPVIALCDLPKVKALLADLQLAEYCLPIETLEMEAFTACFLRLESDAARLESHIGERVDSYLHAVERQYEVAFAHDE